LTVPAFVLTLSVAERLSFAVGVNRYWNVQLFPPLSAMFTVQVPLRAKSPGFAPPVVSEAIVSVPPPVLFNVTVFAELVVPTFRLPKFSDDALSVAIGVAIGADVDDVGVDDVGVDDVAAASVAMNVAPPMFRFVLRWAPVFAAADQPMDVLPVPVVAVETVSQPAPPVTFHVQPAAVVSVVLPVAPPAATLALVGLRVYVHALAWIVGVTPPTTEQLLALLITNGNVRTNPS